MNFNMLPQLAPFFAGQFERSHASVALTRDNRSAVRARPRRTRRRRGAAAVELAVVAPILFLLIFGMIEFSRMVMLRQALTNAAREGSREASLATTLDDDEVDAAVRQYLQGVIWNASDVDQVSVTVTPADLTAISPGTPISVEAGVNFSAVSWLPTSWLHDETVVLTGSSIQRRE